MIKLIVEDNGVGFNVEQAFARRDSFGLSGMRERVALLGGEFEVASHPRLETKRAGRTAGTRISVLLPFSSSDAPGREQSLVIAGRLKQYNKAGRIS
jgi:two-component system sensor histidine kinase DegS